MALKTKDAGLRLRVERELRQDFLEACRTEGHSAAQVLRDFMRTYVSRNRPMPQHEMFDADPGVRK